MEREEPRTDDANGWRRLYAYAVERADELHWSLADLYDNTDVSEGTYRTMMKGEKVFGRQKVKGRIMCEALDWTPDSINRVVEQGLEPLLVSGFSRPEGTDVVPDDIDERVAATAKMLREYRRLQRKRRAASRRPRPQD